MHLSIETVERLVEGDLLRQAYLSQYYFTLDTVENRQYFFHCDDGVRLIVENLIINHGYCKAKTQPLDGVMYTRDYHLEW